MGSLLTLHADLQRGEMLDALIRFDEKRIMLECDVGERRDENSPMAVSLFSFGRTIPFILHRLDLESHYSLHEHRTPLRAHLCKFLLNILSSAGERGRQLFRAAEGMRIICDVIRGNAWGSERKVITSEEEYLKKESACLHSGMGGWNVADPFHSWPFVETNDGFYSETSYYATDFGDDKSYGPKDRMLAAAFLEYMSSESMWGSRGLVEEMMQYPHTLEVLCRVKPPCCSLVSLLVTAPSFSKYLTHTALSIAECHTNQSLPDTVRSFLSTCSSDSGANRTGTGLDTFRSEMIAVKSKSIILHILAHARHNLQASLQEEHSIDASDTSSNRKCSSLTLDSEDTVGSATMLKQEINACCKLLASKLAIALGEVGKIGNNPDLGEGLRQRKVPENIRISSC